MKYQAIVLVVFIGCLILAFLPLMMVENKPDTKLIEADCTHEHYKHRGRDNVLIVCKGDNFEIIDDSGFQGDSLRKIRIEMLRSEL